MNPTTTTAWVVIGCAWVLAAAATYLLTQAMLFYPDRRNIQRYVDRRADAIAGDIAMLKPDYPMRLRNRLRTRYWRMRVTSDLPFCATCVSLWIYLLTAPLVWLYLGAPGRVLGVHAVIVVFAAVAASWLLWLVFSNLLPEGHNALPDRQGVEQDPPSAPRVVPAS